MDYTYTIDYIAKSHSETDVILHSKAYNIKELEDAINWYSNNGYTVLKIQNESGCKN